MRRVKLPATFLLLLLLAVTAGCGTVTYDLSDVPFPLSARPADAGTAVESFEIEGKSVLWVHGLFGQSQPDVAALLREECGDCAGVANFRVEVGGSFHDWLLTHLTATLVRLKTVRIRGDKLVR